ncbi:efflux RND transporter periplasmic adaptor subunit [Niveispirillum irakense]|uniref:efflux RND transporter periplasmic adaptor subunit n=1 Tax=Niveispirillum irakense TaxID=34011 RepID=UPI00040003C6|nr:efflux RND transporter periplasmic adaptor subunit [Niveispirillum irakense]
MKVPFSHSLFPNAIGRRKPVIFPTSSRSAAMVAMVALLALTGCGKPPGNGAAPQAVSSLTVTTSQIQRFSWPRQLSADGAIAAWQEVIIGAEVGGLRLDTLKAEIGDSVKRGDVLATFDDATLAAEEKRLAAALASAKASLEQATADADRATKVGKSGALSAQQLDQYRIAKMTAQANVASAEAQLQSARIRLRQAKVVAADDGIVSARSALLGQVPTAGTELFRLVRQGEIEWQAELDSRQLAQAQVGQKAFLTLPDGQQVEGVVRLVSPTLNNNTSRGIVYVRLPKDSPARAGMYASGHLDLPASDAATLPDTAIVLRDGRSYVYLLQDDMKVRQQVVTVGRRRDGRVEILTPLDATARIVTSGGAFLNDGTVVRLAGDGKAVK